MANVQLFKNSIFSIKDVSRTDTVQFKFELPEGVSEADIDCIRTGCGCSDAYLDRDENAIVGFVEMPKAIASGQTSTVKSVTVFFDKDVPHHLVDQGMRYQLNKDKRQQHLQINISVND